MSSSSSSSSSGTSSCPAATPDTQLEAPIDSEPAQSGAAELEPGSSDAHTIWDSSALRLNGFTSIMSDCNSDMGMVGYDWLQPSGVALDDVDTFEMGQPGLPPWPHLATVTDAASWPTDGTAATNNVTTRSDSAASTGQRLATLVSEIQQQLRRLEEGPWHTDSTYSLHDYPVGTILGLSQQFSAIAGPILSGTACVAGGLEEGGRDEDGRDIMTSYAAADTPNTLLVMCGYMWLVHIYGIVLGHFQKHLHCMPTREYHHLGTMSGGISPIAGGGRTDLRLGELPCADMALSLQQIHTAVRMLLDVLHDIEGHLGRGAVLARDMAVTLLLNSSRLQDGSSRGLGMKAAAVKELLREKMGL
ncbi:hypothetical protein G7Z17_g6811 [Cylindrodendrum hubeiense]|uniref:Uncharacterized protein n=1 Tax=Cylindrodendrum hubeiense TaxID=595255 RepID=A0A9P5H6N0_9HYPO|nr:hypothetical protein G7Z17_g6811 [Cylindrodendrum hubeiense]